MKFQCQCGKLLPRQICTNCGPMAKIKVLTPEKVEAVFKARYRAGRNGKETLKKSI